LFQPDKLTEDDLGRENDKPEQIDTPIPPIKPGKGEKALQGSIAKLRASEEKPLVETDKQVARAEKATAKENVKLEEAREKEEATPTITELSPDSGSIDGGTTVTVIGRGFVPGESTGTGTSGTTFEFGPTAGGASDCTSATECTVVSPAAKKAGTVDVVAMVGETKSKKSAAGQFTYE
jgi:hypothetical protein